MKGGDIVEMMYVYLILEDIRTYASVPKVIKPRVKKALTDLGYPELATEE